MMQVFLVNLVVAQLMQKFPALIDLDCSLSCLQDHATGSCFEPISFSQHLHCVSLKPILMLS